MRANVGYTASDDNGISGLLIQVYLMGVFLIFVLLIWVLLIWVYPIRGRLIGLYWSPLCSG